MVLEDLKTQMPLRRISKVSWISLSGYYHTPRKRHVERLDPSTRGRIREIASEVPHVDTGECGQSLGTMVQG